MFILGTKKSEIIADTEYDDFIFGGAGDDTLLCYRGDDFIFGGAGDDTFIVAPQDDATIFLSGGRGFDTLVLAREPIEVERFGNQMVIHYDYDMIIITDKIEELSI